MRVGLVIYGSIDTVSGGFLYDRMLVDCLRRHGDTVDVISLPWVDYPEAHGHHHDVRIREALLSWKGDLLLEDELAHASLASLNGELRAKTGVPLVAIVHHLRASEGHPWLRSRGHVAVERAYLRSVDAFIFNSATTRRTVESLRGTEAPSVIARPGGDRLGPGPSEEEIALRSAEHGPLRVLFVGNIIPRKGLHTLVPALGMLPADRWRLSIAGSRDVDPLYTAFVETSIRTHQVERNVQWTGALGDEELAQALRTHQVLVVPSRYEGFGIVTLEAMGFGVVPVATRAGGSQEIVDEESGVLVPVGHARALARALRALSTDRARLCALSRGARQRFGSFEGWQASMEKARNFLLELHGES